MFYFFPTDLFNLFFLAKFGGLSNAYAAFFIFGGLTRGYASKSYLPQEFEIYSNIQNGNNDSLKIEVAKTDKKTTKNNEQENESQSQESQYNQLHLQSEDQKDSKIQVIEEDSKEKEKKNDSNQALKGYINYTTSVSLENKLEEMVKDWYGVPENQFKIADEFKISQITSNQIEFEKMVGQGSFGQVWKGKWRETNVAIKQVKQETIDEKSKKKIYFYLNIEKILNFLIFQ